MIDIRSAMIDDALAIARVHAQAHWEAYAPLFGAKAKALDLRATERRWRQALNDGDVALVATDDGVIVGLGHASGDRMEALYLLAAYRRQGIGRALLARILQLMNERGIAQARFNVLAVSADAIAFYRASGAYPIGRCTNVDSGDYDDLIFAVATGV